MLGEKLAELVSFIGEDKAKALSVHSAIESNFHDYHLNQKCPGFSFQRSTKGFVENVPSPIADFGPLLQGVFEKPQKYFLIFLIAAVMLREIA